MTQKEPRRRLKPSDLEDPSFYEALGRAIKVARTELGMSRKELAEAAGVSYPYVADIESGRGRPSPKVLIMLANTLGMSPSELLARGESFAERIADPSAPQRPGAFPAPGWAGWRAMEVEAEVRPMAAAARADAPAPLAAAPSAPDDRRELHAMVDALPEDEVPLVRALVRKILGQQR